MKIIGRKCLLSVLVACAALFLTATSRSQSKREEYSRNLLLGEGRGIDHIMVVVRDLNATTATFRKLLGFNAERWGKFPDGIENAGMHFRNRSYLELLGIYDREKAAQTEEAKFLQRNEGATGVALHVSSADSAANFLRGRGFDVAGPDVFPPPREESQQPQPWMWRTVSFKKRTGPGAIVFLIEYNEQARENRQKEDLQKYEAARVHPNTAEKIQSVWITVKDLDAAVKAYESIGLSAGRRVNLPQLEARGHEVVAGNGVVLLLQANTPKSKVTSFLARRGEGIMGVSIKVAALNRARNILETNIKQKFTPYVGAYGKSILIPAEVTRGVWVELFQ